MPLPNRTARANIGDVEQCLTGMRSILDGIERNATHNQRLTPTEQEISELRQVSINFDRLVQSGELTPELLGNDVSETRHLLRELLDADVATNQLEGTPAVRRPDNQYPKAPQNGPGKPKCEIDKNLFSTLHNTGLSVNRIAKDGMLGFQVSAKTIRRWMKREGVETRQFSDVTDEELTEVVSSYNQDYPNAGYGEVSAFLQSKGLHIQRHRVRSTLATVDPLGTATRWATTIKRRQYSVPSPNSLWHVDTNHALIRWGVIVHGGIDGFSRLVTFLRAAPSNTSKTAVAFFLDGAKAYGVPSRVRADSGNEYTDLERLMNLFNGPDRGSFIAGRSVHNQRIERLWRDVYVKVLDTFYKLFYHLEDCGVLDIDNPVHMFVMQMVFVPMIDTALMEWRDTYNSHKVRTMESKSPIQLWLSGLMNTANSGGTVQNNLVSVDRIGEAVQTLDLNGVPPISRHPNPLSMEFHEQFETICKKDSACNGVDVYGEALEFVISHTQ